MNATNERNVETPCMASLRIKNVCIDLENDLTYERDDERIVETPCMASLRIKNVCIDLENDLTYERDV